MFLVIRRFLHHPPPSFSRAPLCPLSTLFDLYAVTPVNRPRRIMPKEKETSNGILCVYLHSDINNNL